MEQEDKLTTLSHGDFAEHLNTKFRVVEADKSLEFELTEISDVKSGGGQEFFSLFFTADNDAVLPQKLYELEHETLGRGSIFLVPVGEGDDKLRYEAVFNRLTSEQKS